MILPKALWKSLRNGDWAVAASMFVTLLLLGTTLLSTTLITLSPVEFSRPISAQLLDSFVGNWSRVDNANPGDGTIWLTVQGLLNDSVAYPDGSSEDIAYPRLRFSPEENLSRLDSRFNAAGLSFDVQCQSAEIVSVVADTTNWGTEEDPIFVNTLRATVSSSDYEIDIETDVYFGQKYISRYGSGISRNIEVLGLVSLEFNNTGFDTEDVSTPPPLPPIRSSQIMCFPSYQLRQLEIVSRGGIINSVSPLTTERTATLPNVTALDFVDSMLGSAPAYCRDLEDVLPEQCDFDETVNEWEPWMLVGMLLNSTRVSITSAFDTSSLQTATELIFRQVPVLIANQHLRELSQDDLEGEVDVLEDRVLVSPVSAHIMTGLLAGSVLLTCLLSIVLAPVKHTFQMIPNTILEIAALFSHPESLPLRKTLGRHGRAATALDGHNLHCMISPIESGSSNESTTPAIRVPISYMMDSPQSPSTFQQLHTKLHSPTESNGPAALQMGFRMAVALSTVAILIVLEYLLRRSERNVGLADVPNRQAWVYLWQLVPATILVVIRLYHSSVDFNTRALQPFHNMRNGKSSHISVNTNLLDRSLPSLLVTEVRSASLAPLMTTLSRFIASFFTIFSASLFVAHSVPLTTQNSLHVTDAFKISPSEFDSRVQRSVSLVLEGNMSYPSFTFENLILPSLTLDNTKFGNDTISPNLEVTATVTGLRPNLSCRLLDLSSNITVTFTGPDPVSNYSGFIEYETQLGQCVDSRTSGMDHLPDTVYFAEAKWDRGSDCLPGNRHDLPAFIWGMTTRNDPSNVTSSALLCNETLELVSVDVSLFGPELRLDPGLPPIVQMDSATDAPVQLNRTRTYVHQMYESALTIPQDDRGIFWYTDDPFPLLTNSRFAISRSDLGDPSRAEAVAESIRFQLSIVRAQALNAQARIPAHDSGVNASEVWRSSGYADTIPATLTDAQARQRIFQDAVSTRVLQALLGAVLLLSSLGWALAPRAGRALPWSATNVAETLGLLARGNLWEFLPERAQFMSDGELGAVFQGCTFRLEGVAAASQSENEGGQGQDGQREEDKEGHVLAIQVTRSKMGA